MPKNVRNLSEVVGIGAGDGISCAMIAGGGVKCWGSDDYGLLGHPPCADSIGFCSEPVAIKGFRSRLIAIAVGNRHVCAAMENGSIACWGSNSNGQLGDGTKTDSSSPVVMPGFFGGLPPDGLTKPTNTATP